MSDMRVEPDGVSSDALNFGRTHSDIINVASFSSHMPRVMMSASPTSHVDRGVSGES